MDWALTIVPSQDAPRHIHGAVGPSLGHLLPRPND